MGLRSHLLRGNVRVNAVNMKVDIFLMEILEVCRKHGMSISHEDDHGAFVIEPYNDGLGDWLLAAQVSGLPHGCERCGSNECHGECQP